jgi:hypothetical protein
MVAPWLIGPTRFRRLTTGLASAAVVGSMLVHADGVDFTLVQPVWLFFAVAGLVALVMDIDALTWPRMKRSRHRADPVCRSLPTPL